jgi:polysaccharide biosynthesis protein PelB
MEQKRSRLVASDATGLRARILSTGGLLVVAAMVLVVLVMLYPRQQLLDRLRAEPRNDELSVSYLANLLSSEPDNDDLRMLLAERHFALKQADRAEAVLQPLLGRPSGHEAVRLRVSKLAYSLLELRANAATPGSAPALTLREQLIAGLQERLTLPWSTPDLLLFARKATALEQLALAQRFHSLIRFDADGDRAPWFEEAVRTAIWAQDYTGAATLHQRAMDLAPSLERKRHHLREALRILQSGNLLGQALALAQAHTSVVGDDRALLDYLTRLALAANQPAVAEGYARRLLQMQVPVQVSTRTAAPLRWLAAVVDLVVPAAQAAEPVRAMPADPKAAEPTAATRPQPGDPRAPFEETSYLLAYQTFLANRNQNDAWRVAVSAVRQEPANAAWRERLAQVSEWTGKPDEALVHWRALSQMQGATPAMVEGALKAMLRLAPSFNDDELLLDTWRQIAAARRLTVEETLGVVALTERLGRPEEGMQWLQEAERRQPARALREAQADLAERMGNQPATIDALRHLIQKDGATVPRAMRLATLHGLRGEPAMAYEVLLPLAATVPPTDLEYWRLMANLAWTLQIESQALHALGITTRTGEFNTIDADRMLTLLRLRDPREAARFAEKAWGVLHLPGYLVSALDLWWTQRDLKEMERVFHSLASDAEAEKMAGTDAYFWTLRSQWRQARGEMPAAVSDMRRALEIEPDNTGTRVAFLFLLIESGGKGELQRMLTTWQDAAQRNPVYDAAYAAGYMELDQPRLALPHWRRQAAGFRDDPLWNGSYADVLDAAGQPEPAARVRAWALQLTRTRLQTLAGRTGTPTEELQALRLQLARLTLADSQGDSGLRALRAMLAPGGLLAPETRLSPQMDTDTQGLALGWLLANEYHDHARLWLWRRNARALSTPAWAEMTMALHDGDLGTVSRLLDSPEGARLPTAQRIDALQTLGHARRAQARRIAQLEDRDDDGQHETYTDAAWRDRRRVEYSVDTSRDTLRATRQLLAVWLPLTETARLKVAAEDIAQRSGTLANGTPAFGRLAAHDRAGSVTLQFQPDRALQVEGTLGTRSAERGFATVALSASAQLLARLQVRADLGFNARATDSAPLAVAGRQQEARLSADLRLSLTNPVRVSLRAAQFGLQGGGALGNALGLEWEAAHVLRGATPDLSVRVFGNYTRYGRTDGPLPAWTAGLTPDGSQPGSGYFVPDSFALHGIGLSAGLAQRDAYTRAWRPFADLSLTTHSQLGAGYAATVGVAGRLTGSDQLLLQFSTTRAGSSGDARTLGLRYVLPF